MLRIATAIRVTTPTATFEELKKKPGIRHKTSDEIAMPNANAI